MFAPLENLTTLVVIESLVHMLGELMTHVARILRIQWKAECWW
jgi:hypothetical protein